MTPKERQVSTLRQNPYNLNVPCVHDFKVASMRVAGASVKWRLLTLKCKQTDDRERSKLPLSELAEMSARKHKFASSISSEKA